MKKVIITGFAMFAMLFGAGNVVFPLILGRDSGHEFSWGLLGFCLTAVLVPFLGLFGTMLNHGDYKYLLAPLGKIPSFLLILFCMVLIGPFGMIPRCVTISYSVSKMYFPSLSILGFSLLAAVIMFCCTIKNNMVVDILGKVLGPLKVTLLFFIIMKGLFAPEQFLPVSLTHLESFKQGFLSGYGTCDLLGTIFLSGLILSGVKKGLHPEQQSDSRAIIKHGLQASAIGGGMLSLVYAGFCIIAALHGAELATVDRADLFTALAILILGKEGGCLANITVAMACLTTAIALTAMFAMYLHKDLFKGRISYLPALIITIGITTGIATLGFNGIMQSTHL
jgi:LIVCS family branched-chain amino acid:cation transporter